MPPRPLELEPVPVSSTATQRDRAETPGAEGATTLKLSGKRTAAVRPDVGHRHSEERPDYSRLTAGASVSPSANVNLSGLKTEGVAACTVRAGDLFVLDRF